MIVNNNLKGLLHIQLDDTDIIDIFATALIELINEDEFNYDEIIHKENFTKTAVNKGCGCYYCYLRYELRLINILAHNKRKDFDFMYDELNHNQRVEREIEIQLLKQKSKDIKELKKKVKEKINIRKYDNKSIQNNKN